MSASVPECNQEDAIVTRIRIGSWVVDEEHLTGAPSGDTRAIAIYHLDGGGLIDRPAFSREARPRREA